MQIVPVLDILSGEVVRGVAGRRSEYRPITSIHCPDASPLSVAKGLRSVFGFSRFYLADLDAILGGAPSVDLYRRLMGEGVELLVDAGLRTAEEADLLADAGVQTVIAGLETLCSPVELGRLVDRLGPRRVLFSLDLKEGRPLVGGDGWGGDDPGRILAQAVEKGVERALFLDLSRVGVGSGLGTEAWIADARRTYPAIELYAGGGVRGREDLERIRETGVAGVLAASALHDGRLVPRDLKGFLS
jgi:phosphoribosylformimino-5-aminoimidazole carboxamide ribotide isomerase